MQKFNLYFHLPAIKTNLKTINRGAVDCLNYADNQQWQRVLESSNILSLNLNSGELQASQDISLYKIYSLLGLQDKQYIFEEYKSHFSDNQYQALRKFQHMSVPQYDTPFEGLTQIIFGQQVAVAVANKQRMSFVQAMGIKYNDNLYQYPQLQNIQEEQVNAMAISGNKKKSLLAITEYFLNNKTESLDIKQLQEQLIALFGIGQWSVDWFLLRCASQIHIIPSGDLQIRKVFAKFFNNPDFMDSKKLKELEKTFYPIGGLLAHCLLLNNNC
ncbi:MAG: hypothetical protein FWE18_01250 [Alphaproteobacteria bacterium]|nr:hypothetical protein [Alphaproteobacteria bacterium]